MFREISQLFELCESEDLRPLAARPVSLLRGNIEVKKPPPEVEGMVVGNPHDLTRGFIPLPGTGTPIKLLGGGKSHMIFWNFHPGKLGK